MLALVHILLLSLAGIATAQNASKADLERFWSYGRSPPVYPGPSGAGIGNWTDAYNRAREMVSRMTNEEKEHVTNQVADPNSCAGNSGGVESVGFPGLCLHDGPAGVRGVDGVSAFPAGIHIGASWNAPLAKEIGGYMGAEFRRKGVNVALGPVVGPLGRVARGGRNWEGFGADPYLSGAMAAETIRGLQRSVIACVKHFIGNEQETDRNPSQLDFVMSGKQSVSSNIDDKTMHELYLWPFQDAVRAGVGSVMCSYNRVNNSYGCQNSKMLNGLLKLELGFQGFVVSDWGAEHSRLASASAGLDMVMNVMLPNITTPTGGALVQAVNNGSFAQWRLDDMATRIVASWFRIGMDAPNNPTKGVGMNQAFNRPRPFINARDQASKQAILQAAYEGHVLVKNVKRALPLRTPTLLSLFGYDATAPVKNNPSGPNDMIWNLGLQSSGIGSIDGLFLLFGLTNPPGAAKKGTLIGGGGSGANSPPYISAPYDAFQQKAYEDGTTLLWDFESLDPAVEAASDACVVMINEFALEGADRPSLADGWSDRLVMNVAEKCNNTVVVIHNAGIRLVDAWIGHPNVTAVIYAHLPGQDSGRALIDILYGKVSPSGRLPYTVAKMDFDYSPLLQPDTPPPNTNMTLYPQSTFSEGVNIDYRHFLTHNKTPRFEFGYGLTYSRFEYSGLQTAMLSFVVNTINDSFVPPRSPTAEGGPAALWDRVATVDCRVRNVGAVTAAEVVQLYIGIPNAPKRQLRGFVKRELQPGQTGSFHFELTRRDLSVWSPKLQNWVLQQGLYNVYVGASVLDVRLQGAFEI
ncbi:beta-glucosidase [Trichodelitschia bisporula]|uniref:beta-glucosidase n=1 Tax=Trichodelitschia bisporula TaxID=703511 RepID=A0A6G1I417_9PEZI|nr:beta-glucosidase [Trichodelitschia bisporula]